MNKNIFMCYKKHALKLALLRFDTVFLNGLTLARFMDSLRIKILHTREAKTFLFTLGKKVKYRFFDLGPILLNFLQLKAPLNKVPKLQIQM